MSVSHFYHYPTIEYKKAALYVRCSKEEQAKFGDTIEGIKNLVAKAAFIGYNINRDYPMFLINFPVASYGVLVLASLSLFAASCGELNPLFN